MHAPFCGVLDIVYSFPSEITTDACDSPPGNSISQANFGPPAGQRFSSPTSFETFSPSSPRQAGQSPSAAPAPNPITPTTTAASATITRRMQPPIRFEPAPILMRPIPPNRKKSATSL